MNGVEIVDKIDRVPQFIVIMFAVIAVILWCIAAIGVYKDDIIGYVVLLFAIVCTIVRFPQINIELLLVKILRWNSFMMIGKLKREKGRFLL